MKQDIKSRERKKKVPKVISATQTSWSISGSLPKTGEAATTKSTTNKGPQEMSTIFMTQNLDLLLNTQ